MHYRESTNLKLDEFSLIEKYFKSKTISRKDVLLGIGDDAALLTIPQKQLLVSSIDTLIENVHFLASTKAFDVGYKSLAANLSDLAAMGANPAWFLLALTLPTINTAWLDEFTQGLFECATQFNLQLVGGDLTRGPLSITIQINGFVPEKKALCRSGAKAGDKIYVSGTLGDAGLGLKIAKNNDQNFFEHSEKLFLLDKLNKPIPKIQLGILLRELASSAIDISDGLAADLDHILKSSDVGACINAEKIPLSSALKKLSQAEALQFAMTAGDDYELCFTIPSEKEEEFIAYIKKHAVNCTCIGVIEKTLGLRTIGFSGQLDQLGFQHF